MIALRPVLDSDLPIFWEHSSDPDAQYMAAVTRPYHHDRQRFDEHWSRVRSSSDALVRAVLADDVVVGHAAVYGPPQEREVTYWIGRKHWGRGIGTAALAQLIDLDDTRPLHAHAAADNAASIRVLERCGFVITARGRGVGRARGGEIDEVSLTLT
jgi:RimJ/RimL family protein N-acetyltransferase